jgi:hypothetical protein
MALEELLPVSIYELFPNILLPFLLTFIILYAVLTLTRIFSNKINIVLAFGFTIFAGYAGFFEWMATWFARSMALVVIAIFGIVFVLGSLTWGLGRAKESYYGFLSPGKKLDKLYKEREKILKQIKNTRDNEKKRVLYHKLQDVEYQIAIERSKQIK